ncbi:hypothetical protein HZ994_16300 [Akkermansiaceae bacterium]|nr:hypothetical protein HZ994_16300 [Akkermansiaceae bacterium]
MKNPLAARFPVAFAIALISSNCTNSNEPFFRFNSPFEKGGLKGYDHFEDSGIDGDPEDIDASGYFGSRHIPLPAAGDSSEALLPERSSAPGAGVINQPAPEIQVLKRGAAGTMCYTCRGKGYVFQPTTLSAGNNHTCPACGGDGRN